jgi:hypothetical protein
MAFRVSRSRVYGDGQTASVRLAPARHVFRCDSAMSDQGRWGEDLSAKAAGCRSRPAAAVFELSCGGHSDRSGRSGRGGFLWWDTAALCTSYCTNAHIPPIQQPETANAPRSPLQKHGRLATSQCRICWFLKPSSPESRNGDFTLRIQIGTIRRCWWLSQPHCAGAATSPGPPDTGRCLPRWLCLVLLGAVRFG